MASILALDGNGERLMPLAEGRCSSAEALRRLKAVNAKGLFPAGRAPEAALAGLYLYFSCMEESHAISQSVETPDGSYWHGLLHRQEPDPGNAAHWFRRAGKHPVLPAVRSAAAELGIKDWDPFQFIDYCEAARRRPASEEERIALLVQRAEWQLLFDYCAKP